MEDCESGKISRNIAKIILILGILSAFVAGIARGEDLFDSAYEIQLLSSRPDMVTGADALVGISAAAEHDLSAIRVFLDAMEVTSSFPMTSSGIRSGLVNNLPEIGTFRLTDSDGRTLDSLPFRNYPATGPVFSGPQQQPFICETDAFLLVSGETLGQSLDEACSIRHRIDYAYRSILDGKMKALVDPNVRPEDIATTTTVTGATVPFIVRIETGTLNRAIYQIAMLQDPSTDDEPDPWTSTKGWNGRLIYTFGGGCVNGWFRQGARTGGVTDPWMLGLGYAIASSTLNVFGNNCNDVLAAETTMMVKERFIEGYGVPLYTIGMGCSGGSYQAHQTADNYPGLLDGIIPGCSFPEVGFSTVSMITDARLLNRYFKNEGVGLFTKEQQKAVAGFLVWETMPNVSHKAGRITIGEFCPDVLPQSLRYHPKDNPTGARCEVFEHYVNVYGRNSMTGFVRRPLDNVGVQYGLLALNDGVISPAQFLDLNEKIGGYDSDGQFQPNRTVADLEAVRIAYETGRLTSGGGGLAHTPIIDYRAYSDDLETGDVHTRYHSFSMRERLRKANGRIDNHIMLVEDYRYGLYNMESPLLRSALRYMDQWLQALAVDDSVKTLPDKLAQAKPEELTDACWSRNEKPVKIVETQQRDSGKCNLLYPSPPSPREVAGAPLAGDIVKCQLKPVDLTDYAVAFLPGERNRLRQIFSAGVCDWNKPGVGQTGLKGTWQSFSPRS